MQRYWWIDKRMNKPMQRYWWVDCRRIGELMRMYWWDDCRGIGQLMQMYWWVDCRRIGKLMQMYWWTNCRRVISTRPRFVLIEASEKEQDAPRGSTFISTPPPPSFSLFGASGVPSSSSLDAPAFSFGNGGAPSQKNAFSQPEAPLPPARTETKQVRPTTNITFTTSQRSEQTVEICDHHVTF